MDNFKAVYKILSALEKAMDYPEFDINDVGSEALGVSEERWARYIEMMVDVGYIKGVSIKRDITGATRINASDVRITLKGLEYLQENSMMKKVYIRCIQLLVHQNIVRPKSYKGCHIIKTVIGTLLGAYCLIC